METVIGMEFKTTFAFLVFVVVEAQSTCLFFCCLEMSLMDINFIIIIIIINNFRVSVCPSVRLFNSLRSAVWSMVTYFLKNFVRGGS